MRAPSGKLEGAWVLVQEATDVEPRGPERPLSSSGTFLQLGACREEMAVEEAGLECGLFPRCRPGGGAHTEASRFTLEAVENP